MTHTLRPLLELVGVRKVYGRGAVRVEALQGIDLAIHAGEYVAIMGPSGSGKSTLLHILGCLDRPTTGSYRVAGEAVERLGAGRLARMRNREIGFVFQAFHLLPGATVRRNVELPLVYAGLPAGERRRRSRAALDEVDLSDRDRHRSHELSGGQKQRVAIARALVTNPSILLADEPTGNLDSQASRTILELFDRLHRQGQTIVLVTHDPDTARRAGRVVVLHDGRIADDAPSRGAEEVRR